MNLGSKIPVPEVDELRLARMERDLVAKVAQLDSQASSSRTRWARVAIGAVAVAGVVLAIALNLRATQQTHPGTAVLAPVTTRLATGPGQSDQLMLGDATVEVRENTDIAVQRFSDGRTLIVLDKGSVHCEVEPREARPVFQVRAGDVDVTVVGTAFDVARDKTVKVAVQRGIVSVATSHETLRLHAGESWQGSPRADRTVASLLGDGPEHQEAMERPDEPSATNGSSADSGTSRVRDAGPRGDKPRRDKAGSNKTVNLRDVLKGANPIRPVVLPSHGAKARELLSVSASNPAKAARALEALAATSTSHEASFASYSRAYLLFFKLGKRTEVVREAKRYEKRFPRGREAEDMLWLRVRASCDAERYSSSCRAAAHTYRRRYPQGVFQGLASRIIRSKKTE